jgi:sugar transferase (PEP-CTERM system associated)
VSIDQVSELLSFAQSSFALAYPLRPTQRRVLILASGDTEPLLKRISIRGGRVEIVRVISPSSDSGWDDSLSAQLAPESLRRDRIWGIVVASGDQHRLPAALLLSCRLNGIRVLNEGSFWEQEACWIDIDSQDPSWFLTGSGFRYGRVEDLRKRLFDIVTATALLILTVPLMVIVAVLIKWDSSGPVFYGQERVGLRGRTFMLYKFRSMREDAEAAGPPRWATVGDPRITRFGTFIRYTRIDELPQLLNVLRGEMSIIGPRPERPYFVEKLGAAIPLYSVRHYVKPGITGWAQVNAPYGASIEDGRQKLRYDLYYIKYRGLLLDLLILLRTIRVVVLREGGR